MIGSSFCGDVASSRIYFNIVCNNVLFVLNRISVTLMLSTSVESLTQFFPLTSDTPLHLIMILYHPLGSLT